MNIGNVMNRSTNADFKMGIKFSGGNAKENENIENEEKTKKDAGSFKAVELLKKEEKFSQVAMLQKQKESLRKRLSGYNDQLTAIEKQKNEVPFEVTENVVNGKTVLVKSYTEENQKVIDNLDGQKETTLADIKTANEELTALDEEIRKATIEQEKKKVEEMNRQREEESKKRAEKKNEQLTEEEKKEKAERAKVEFFAQSDSIKKYINDSKITQAKMKAAKTFEERNMAIDAQRAAETETRAAYSAREAELDVLEEKTLRETGEEVELVNPMPKTPDSTMLEHLGRVRDGVYTPDEAKSLAAKDIADLQEGIENIESSINESMGKINKKAEEVKEEEKDKNVIHHFTTFLKIFKETEDKKSYKKANIPKVW